MNNFEAELALSYIEYIGSLRYKRLIEYFGSASAVFSAELGELKKIVPARVANLIFRGIRSVENQIEKHLIWQSEKPNRFIITQSNNNYPELLKNIPDPPPVIYGVGRSELLIKPSIAIVGSRRCSPEGLKTTEYFAEKLSEAGLCVVSGLASGIDSTAHKSSLYQKGSTVAVMATGMDLVYPSQNKNLAIELAEHGCLISEHPLGMPPIGKHFPQRNRIISGLSIAVVIIEATDRSGTLVTARQAIEQGREVFALPGSIYSETHAGCHLLLKRGEAGLADSVDDILAVINQRLDLFSESYQSKLKKQKQTIEKCESNPNLLEITTSNLALTKQEELINLDDFPDSPSFVLEKAETPENLTVLSFLSKNRGIELDELSEKTNLPIEKLLELLLNLELDNKIIAEMGFYKLA